MLNFQAIKVRDCKNGLTRSLKYWNTLGGSYSGYPSCYPSLTWHISSGAHSERQG